MSLEGGCKTTEIFSEAIIIEKNSAKVKVKRPTNPVKTS